MTIGKISTEHSLSYQFFLQSPLQFCQSLLQLLYGLQTSSESFMCGGDFTCLHACSFFPFIARGPNVNCQKASDPVLVAELLLQLSVDFLDVIQVIHGHAAVLILLTDYTMTVELLGQGFHLHFQVGDLDSSHQARIVNSV